ncbi:sulfotransferase domain-containing protein [Alcanivorax sp. HI0083]|nr:sulfotransferase domain-containing protein [Alcanivorax sp. HI0083]
MRFFADSEDSIRLVEFPKSGGSWVAEMLSDVCGIDFPRNTFPVKRKSIFHGHSLIKGGFERTVVVWRDPRDVMVSWYHHCIIGNSHVNPSFIEQCRKSFGVSDYDDIKKNMAAFIRWAFDTPPSPGFNWSDFFDAWEKNAAEWVRYEDLRTNPVETLSDLAFRITGNNPELNVVREVVERHSFKNKSGRKYGQEDKGSFLRKGAVGDWRNYFDEECLTEFEKRVGSRMEKLGYQ